MAETKPVELLPTRTRARDPEERGAASAVLDQAILEIARAMASGQWVTGASHLVLVETYGITIETARSWASDAARFLRLCALPEAGDLRARNAATLEHITTMALQDGDAKTAIAAIAESNRLQGLTARVEGANVAVNVSVSLEQHPQFAELQARLIDALAPYPEARVAVARALRGQ